MSIPESALNYGSILTLAGENAEINGKLNSKPINFTHIAIGDANDVYVQPSRTQTALVHELARIPITGMEKITPSKPDAVPQLKVWAKIPDDIVDIAVREFAVVATFDGTSYLHAVGNTVRIPILSGSNNGGEVNDIYIEMTFAVTSLDPIVMIDPTIVTATRKFVKDEDAKHLVAENPHPQYLSLTRYEKDALSFKQEWSPFIHYGIGHEVVRNGLRYIARAASGPDNGGAVTPGGSDWSIWEPVEINIGWGSKEAVSVIDSDSNPITWIPGALMGVARFISATIGSHPTRGQVIVTRYQKADDITDTNLLLMGTNGNIYKRRYSVSGWTSGWVELVGNDDKLPFLCVPIGAEIAFDTPPPTNDPRFRFVKLTADDAYNGSLLNNKVISGTAPNLVVKMTVNSALSPINGQQIEMLNTMMAIPTPGLTSGAIIQDAMRNLTGSLRSYYLSGNALATGVLSHSAFGSTPAKAGVVGVDPGANYFFDFDASRQVPTADRFQPFGVTRVFYKRVY